MTCKECGVEYGFNQNELCWFCAEWYREYGVAGNRPPSTREGEFENGKDKQNGRGETNGKG